MDSKVLRSVFACAFLALSFPALAQNVRYERQGTAYVNAEDQWIAERAVDNVIGTQPGSQGQIVFFRPPDHTPGNLGLSADDNLLAQLPSGAYYAIAVAPGSHTYMVDGYALSVLVAPGERRYVKVSHAPAGPQLSPTNALTFLRLVTGKRQPLFLY